MLSFPFLTDAPAPKQSRDGVLLRLNNTTMTDTERALARRILARQWGNATPAQALLCLSLFHAARCSAPVADPAKVAFTVEVDDKPHVHRHWGNAGSVKEHNALIRLLDRDFGTANRDRFMGRVAWLVTASQADIQAFLKTVGLPDANGGRVQIPGKQGCTGFLMQTELFPFIRKNPPPVAPVDDGCDILSMFGED